MREHFGHLHLIKMKNTLWKPMKWGLITALFTSITSLSLPNYYRSEASLLPVEAASSGGAGGLSMAAAAIGLAVGSPGGIDSNFVDILNSRWMMEQLLNTRFKFHQRFWRFGREYFIEETLYSYFDKSNMDKAIFALNGSMTATRDIKSNIITLTVETKSPELSQAVVREATALLNQFMVRNSRTRGGERATFAESRLHEAERELQRAELELNKFLQKNRNYRSSLDPDVILNGQRLEAELNLRRQLVTTLALNREQALLDAKNDIPILNVLDTGNLPIEKSRPSRLILVLAAAFLASSGCWTIQNWDWVKNNIIDGVNN